MNTEKHFPHCSVVKNPPAKAVDTKSWVHSLDWEDSLEKEMDIHSSVLAWKILWTEEPGGLQSMVSQRVRHDWVTEHTEKNETNKLKMY